MANRSAVHSIGRSQPAEARALPTTITISGTTAIPNPGTPLLAIPTNRPQTAPKIHCQTANGGIRAPRYTTGEAPAVHSVAGAEIVPGVAPVIAGRQRLVGSLPAPEAF